MHSIPFIVWGMPNNSSEAKVEGGSELSSLGHVYYSAMGFSDKALGGLMLVTAAFVFTYYTLWALILPLLPADSNFHNKFPPREWAVRIPAALLLVGLTGIGGILGVVMMKEAKKQREKRALKSA
ncbi:hypothetical protein FRB91_011961 [Serendipita sp. 411]|nr:hypothetical protein FRB91_011961 [Serendipita sp. 411]